MADDDNINELLGVRGDAQREIEDLKDQMAKPDRADETHDDLGLSDDPGPSVEDPPAEDPPAGRKVERERERQQTEPPAGLLQERQKRQELEARQAILQQRLDALQSVIASAQDDRQKALKSDIPDPDEDIVGYTRALAKQVEELQSTKQQLEADQAYRHQIDSVRAAAQADAMAFAQERRDFRDAYQFLRQGQIKELTAAGVDPATAAAHVDQQELQLVALNQQQGRNSAQAIYDMAVARGWSADRSNSDRPPAPPSVNQQRPVHRQSLADMSSAMAENQSLDHAAGGSAAIPNSLEAFARMSDAEFARHADKVARMMRQQLGR